MEKAGIKITSRSRSGKFWLFPVRKHTIEMNERPFGTLTVDIKQTYWLFWVWGTRVEKVSVNTKVTTTDILKGVK